MCCLFSCASISQGYDVTNLSTNQTHVQRVAGLWGKQVDT